MEGNGKGEITYPFTSVQIAPNGLLLTIAFSQTISFNVVLDMPTCHEIAKNIILQEKRDKDTLELARRIQQKGNIA